MGKEIILQPDYECRIFINANGGITIIQPAQDHDDMVVIASKNRVNQLIKALQEFKKIATFEPDKNDA